LTGKRFGNHWWDFFMFLDKREKAIWYTRYDVANYSPAEMIQSSSVANSKNNNNIRYYRLSFNGGTSKEDRTRCSKALPACFWPSRTLAFSLTLRRENVMEMRPHLKENGFLNPQWIQRHGKRAQIWLQS
jgi:hypothetical protein